MIARFAVVLSIAALASCREVKTERAVDHERHMAGGRKSTFAVQAIDDAVDPIPSDLPLREGARIDDESAPFGVSTAGMPRDTGVHYLRIAIPKNASIEAAYATGEQMLRKIDPGGTRAFAFGPIAGWEEDVTDPQAVAVRSFLLRGEPSVTGQDVVSVSADLVQSPRVTVTLTAEGGNNMRRLTRKVLGRRLAILVDGRVVSAPAFTHEVGKTIVFGVTSFDDAKRIADRVAP